MVASITANPQGQGLLLKSYFCGFFFFTFPQQASLFSRSVKEISLYTPWQKKSADFLHSWFLTREKKWLKNVVLPFIVTMLGGGCAGIRLLSQLWRLRQEGLQLRPV